MRSRIGLGRLRSAVVAVFATGLLFTGAVPRGLAAESPHRIRVPFESRNGHVFVAVHLNGEGPFAFALDTGATNSVDNAIAARLHLIAGNVFAVHGVGVHVEEGRPTRVTSMQIGDLVLTEQRFTILSFAEIARSESSEHFDGLIGYEALRHYAVTVDYERHVVEFADRADAAAPVNATIVPFRLIGTTPAIEATVDGFSGSFTLDTGDRGSLTLMEPFYRRHQFVQRYAPNVHGITGWGFGGPVRSHLIRVQHFSIGEIDIGRPLTRLPTGRAGFFTSRALAGSIGAGIFARFTVTFDYPQRRLILRPNAHLQDAEVYDRSGMWLTARADGFEIADVISGSPADSSGLRAGDVITAVDGIAATSLGLQAVREQLKAPPGTAVEVDVRDDGGDHKRTFILRELV